MKNSPVKIALCGWESGKVTDDFLVALSEGNVQVSWGIFNQLSPNLFQHNIHQFHEDEIVADISGRSICDKWTLTLKDLSEYDSKMDIILRVQERWLVGHWNIDDRLYMIHSAIQYFKKILEEIPVKVIFFSTASPHHFYNTVLTVVAESMGIKCLFINFSFISDRFNFVEGIEKKPVNVQLNEGDLAPYVEYLKSLKKEDFRPAYIKAYFNYRASSFSYFNSAVLPKIILKTIYSVYYKRSTGLRLYRGKSSFRLVKEIIWDHVRAACELRSLKKFYYSNIAESIEKNSIIYFANYQPEATSNPDGGKFPDVRYYISSLKASGKKVYFKEHPTMFNYSNGGWVSDMPRHRSLKYYQDLLNLGVELVDPKKLTSQLFENAHCIFSLTGTVAMEASIKGVQTCLAGYSWYGDLPGVVRLEHGGVDYPASEPLSESRFLEHFLKVDQCSLGNVLGVASAKESQSTSLRELGRAMIKVTREITTAKEEKL